MYEFLATLTLIIHFLFILYVILGGLLFFIKPGTLYFHIPAFLYGVYVEFTQSICPLTYLENFFLSKAKIETYSTSFIQNYLIPVIYPVNLTKELQTTLGVLLIIINLVIYVIIFKKFKNKFY
ncbi:MAG: DUF2784 domain-containing protein [Alphaproteobacteria bacterium]|nr:DUF2784 domain-containing protein [Alphaproteobacteria bacterium]